MSLKGKGAGEENEESEAAGDRAKHNFSSTPIVGKVLQVLLSLF